MWCVIIHNDDTTPLSFVILLIIDVFKINPDTATLYAWSVHNNGCTGFGPFTHDVAETKRDIIVRAAQENGYDLKCTINPQ